MLKINVRALIIARLLVATLFLCFGFWNYSALKMLFLYLVVFLSVISLLYLIWYVIGKYTLFLVLTQLTIDLIWETLLIHYTGGVYSIFIVFFILTIISTSLVLPHPASLWMGAISSIILVLLVLLEFNTIQVPFLNTSIAAYYSYQDWFSVLYILMVYSTLFCIVGYIGLYFSKKIYNLEIKIKNQEQLTILGELTTNIAHEIKNPLTAITGSIEVLKKDIEPTLSQENRELMECVLKETHRLKKILTSILDYSHVNRRKCSNFDLIQIIEEIIPMLENISVDNKDVEIFQSFGKRPMNFYGDSDRIKQMLFNLILNAYESIPSKGRIDLYSRLEDGAMCLTIKDNGVGVPEKVKRHIYEPFQSTKKGGTGLGLAIVYKIVQSHDGTIEMKSQENIGTEFNIRFPIYAE